MRKISVTVDNIERSAEKLLREHQKLKQEKKDLINSLEAANILLAEKEEAISALIEKSRVLQVAQTIDPEDKKEVRKTINEMLREVDKCIAQLNK